MDTTKPILPTIDVAKTRVNGAAALRVQVTMAQPQPMSSEAAIARLLGPDRKWSPTSPRPTSTRSWRATRAKRPFAAASGRPGVPESGFAAKADVAKTAALLPDGAQAVAYLSPKGIMSLVNPIEAKFAMPGVSAHAVPACVPRDAADRDSLQDRSPSESRPR